MINLSFTRFPYLRIYLPIIYSLLIVLFFVLLPASPSFFSILFSCIFTPYKTMINLTLKHSLTLKYTFP